MCSAFRRHIERERERCRVVGMREYYTSNGIGSGTTAHGTGQTHTGRCKAGREEEEKKGRAMAKKKRKRKGGYNKRVKERARNRLEYVSTTLSEERIYKKSCRGVEKESHFSVDICSKCGVSDQRHRNAALARWGC